ncbi:DUF1127 domain-containing protein [Lentibacter sp. XHP0401]|uniref:DUF1127 domain-containing protein n=1 Tax=Lentibacter sp. XHP0401 TaxID=2984334 RepID=UPI0021E7F7E2|nr:hypothetical protein [Lentibacter sp. XHP0401]MCV2891555.1 hypothetical protein [Lentibacter sp. XHP0401]
MHASSTCQSHCSTPVSRTGLGHSILRLLQLSRSRRALASLTGDQLCDIGMDKTAARNEAKRPIWDVPQTWRS